MRAGERFDPNPKIEFPTATAFSITACHILKPCSATFIKPPTKPATAIVFNPLLASAESLERASSPAFKTSAVAIPSGYLSFASTINARRRGTVKRTPINPPMAAILATSM